MFVQCHVEQTDQFGNPITTSNTLSSSTPTARFRRNVAKEVDDNDEEEEEEEEEDMDQEEEEEEEKQLELYLPIQVLFPLLLEIYKNI